MNKRLYYADAFTRRFSARVVDQMETNGRFAVILDQTFFYPTSGGQPHDTGHIAGIPVQDVTIREEDGAILHWLQTAVSHQDQIEAEIDWPRRFDHMQQHTGQHILSQAFIRVADAATVGFHLSDNSVTIDLDTDTLSHRALQAAEQLANDIIWQNRPIHVKMVTPSEAEALPLRKIPATDREKLRLVDIEAFDLTACGGTHVRATGAVGQIKVVRTENRRQQLRVEFCCGQRALQDYRQKHTIVTTLMGELTTGADNIVDSVMRLQTESKEAQRTIRRQQETISAHEAEALRRSAESFGPYQIVTAVQTEGDHGTLRALAQQLIQSENTFALLTLAGERTAFVFGRADDAPGDMNALLQQTLRQTEAGSGGGSAQMAQGGGPPLTTTEAEQVLKTAVASLKKQIDKTDGTNRSKRIRGNRI